MTEIETNGIDRRTVVKGAAWSVPVIAAAVATPLAAATNNGLLDLNAGCIQVAGVSLFPGYSVNNVGTGTYNGTIIVEQVIDLSNIALDIGLGGVNNQGVLSSGARSALWAVLLIQGIASGSSGVANTSNWEILQQGPTRPIIGGRYAAFSYRRTITITAPIAAGGSAYWGNLLDISGILNILDGLGIGASLINQYATITSPVGNPPVVDAGPSTLSWNLIGGC